MQEGTRTNYRMSDDHKEALAVGRNEGRIIRSYLDALAAHLAPKKRGRKRTSTSVEKRLVAIEEAMAVADPLERVKLIQEQMDLTTELSRMDSFNAADLAKLEEGFVSFAKGYSERKGITWAAWRTIGVPPDVLRKAGITKGD